MDAKAATIAGRVILDQVDTGSKSERQAVLLETDAGRKFVLRRTGGPAFGDNFLDKLVGSSIVADGVQVGQTLIMKHHRQR